MPAVPSCILDPLREQFLALLPARVDDHPLGCHRPRIDDAVVFDKLIEALVFGAGYERIADAACSATTMRRRRDEWIRRGIFDRLRLACLDAYERMVAWTWPTCAWTAAPPRRLVAVSAPVAAPWTGARAG